MIEKYTKKNQLVKCVYLISLRIQPSLLASHAARDVLRKRRCPSPKTSLPAREGCIRIFPVILIQSWVTLEVFLHFAKVKTVWCLFSLQQLAIKISRLDRKSSSFFTLFTAVMPKRLYKTHTPCIHYHLRDNTHRLLLWPYTSPCPLSTSWHLFRMVCFSLFPPHPSP